MSQRGHQRIYHHVSRPGIERDHVVQLCAERQKRQVPNAADVLNDARPRIIGKQHPICVRHQWGPLPSGCHVTHAEIGHRCDTGPLRDNRRLADLQGRGRPRIRQMVNGLPVRADGRNIPRLEFRPADDRQGRASKLLAESKVQLADFRNRTVETQIQDVLPQHRRERVVGV